MARNIKFWLEWEDHLNEVLRIKPAEVVEEACQVMDKHGCRVDKDLKSELYYVMCHKKNVMITKN